jgi:signal transduction histidine kinase
VELCLFRIVQEALTNVVKHSSASTATVSLYATGDTLQLSVADNGCGFNTSATADRQGLGLESMRERLHLVDGELVIRSRAGEGTTIDARVPLTTLASEPAADGSTRVA